ncbi:hypothetical protein EDB81DRAFT_768539 [Dactylonectria macrodidyma]|uniref:Uncharacterized protein n=1 Tax=Dactylonectria macrodidyma TaxID=307937 RepID=A0A9P9D391_9HYPO|nr:hypothetical protein EDB81DRAFT_768539 [Dactylonectria macrodidyma]
MRDIGEALGVFCMSSYLRRMQPNEAAYAVCIEITPLLLTTAAQDTTRLVYPSLLQDPSLSNKTPIDGMDTREIVGLAVGVVTALSIFVVGVWFVYRRRQRSKNGFHLGGTNLERHSSGLEGGIAPRTPCADATPSCELSSELSDSRNPNSRRDDCNGDPKARQNHKLPCTDVDPHSGLSSDLSYSQNPNGQRDDYTRDPEYSLPRIYIAVFVLEPAQDYASSLLADKEEILSPDGSYVCSLFVNCKFTGLDAHYQFRDLYTSPSEPDEIRAFYATTQGHRDTPIDGIIYDPGIDA